MTPVERIESRFNEKQEKLKVMVNLENRKVIKGKSSRNNNL